MSAVNEAGESGRARFVCAVGNGCRQLTPVVKISSDSPLVPSGLRSGDRFRLIFPLQHPAQRRSHRYLLLQQVRAGPGGRGSRGHPGPQRRVPGGGLHRGRGRRGDNTGTNGIGLGIWWLGGAKPVDNYVDFYDGSWDEEVTVRDESGAAVTIPSTTNAYDTWTGCEPDGTEGMDTLGSIALGTTTPGVGALNFTGTSTGPLNRGDGRDSKATLNYLYGLSYIFEVR